jgi:hypothetical protein
MAKVATIAIKSKLFSLRRPVLTAGDPVNYRATFTARFSRMTVTFICPG